MPEIERWTGAIPELWKVYDHQFPGKHMGHFRQFDVPTEVVVRGTELVTPTQGRVWLSDFKIRPDGTICHYRAANDGLGTWLECIEVFEDRGDDGHTEYALVGYRYVPAGSDPWDVGPDVENAE